MKEDWILCIFFCHGYVCEDFAILGILYFFCTRIFGAILDDLSYFLYCVLHLEMKMKMDLDEICRHQDRRRQNSTFSLETILIGVLLVVLGYVF